MALAALAAVAAAAAGCASPGSTLVVPQDTVRLAVFDEPDGTAVGFALTVPGSARDTATGGTLLLLAAQTILDQVRPTLASVGATADVSCDAGHFTFRMLAPPHDWRVAADVLLEALARPNLSESALLRARLTLTRRLLLDVANPAWQARLAARQALYGTDPPWGAPGCGVPEVLSLHGIDEVRAAARRFAEGPLTAALVGPVVPLAAEAYLRDRIEPLVANGTRTAYPHPPDPRAMAPDTFRYVERNTITAWATVALPFGRSVDLEAVRLLGAVLIEGVTPDVSRAEVFDASYELIRHGDGGALVVHVVTTPETARAYAHRIEAVVRAIAADGIHPAAYARALRAHRGRRLVGLEAPEDRAADAAVHLALGGEPRSWPRPGAGGQERLRHVAASLSEPVRALVGPRSVAGGGPP